MGEKGPGGAGWQNEEDLKSKIYQQSNLAVTGVAHANLFEETSDAPELSTLLLWDYALEGIALRRQRQRRMNKRRSRQQQLDEMDDRSKIGRIRQIDVLLSHYCGLHPPFWVPAGPPAGLNRIAS